MATPTRAFLATNGVVLHTALAGPENGPPVILLHGFPDFWFGWRDYLAPLAAAGFRVLAPDQRGYNLSSKPSGIEAYRLDVLVDDVIGLIEGAGRRQASVVGHDFGGAVAWRLAQRHPERVEKLAVFCCPHPLVFRTQLARWDAQRLRSWYMGFFQVPRLPEWAMAVGGGRPFLKQLARGARPGTFAGHEEAYLDAWAQPGARTGMLQWYRAAAGLLEEAPGTVPAIAPPTQLYWGKRDAFLGHSLATESLAACAQGELIEHAEGTHWLPQEAPAEVLLRLLPFLSSPENR